MPVWHASLSIWSGPTGREAKVSAARLAEAEGVRLMRGVGNDREWWWWNPVARVGHLRVGLTLEEYAGLPRVPVFSDAGEAGPERPRTR